MQRPTTPSSRPHTPTLKPETPRTAASKSVLSETLMQPKTSSPQLLVDSDDELQGDEKVAIIKGLRAENVQLVQKVQDMSERMKKNDIQTDLIRCVPCVRLRPAVGQTLVARLEQHPRWCRACQ